MITWISLTIIVNLIMRYGLRRGAGLIPANAFIGTVLILANKPTDGLGVIVGLAISLTIMVIINRTLNRANPVE